MTWVIEELKRLQRERETRLRQILAPRQGAESAPRQAISSAKTDEKLQSQSRSQEPLKPSDPFKDERNSGTK
jgi:hypothetical protein